VIDMSARLIGVFGAVEVNMELSLLFKEELPDEIGRAGLFCEVALHGYGVIWGAMRGASRINTLRCWEFVWTL